MATDLKSLSSTSSIVHINPNFLPMSNNMGAHVIGKSKNVHINPNFIGRTLPDIPDPTPHINPAFLTNKSRSSSMPIVDAEICQDFETSIRQRIIGFHARPSQDDESKKGAKRKKIYANYNQGFKRGFSWPLHTPSTKTYPTFMGGSRKLVRLRRPVVVTSSVQSSPKKYNEIYKIKTCKKIVKTTPPQTNVKCKRRRSTFSRLVTPLRLGRSRRNNSDLIKLAADTSVIETSKKSTPSSLISSYKRNPFKLERFLRTPKYVEVASVNENLTPQQKSLAHNVPSVLELSSTSSKEKLPTCVNTKIIGDAEYCVSRNAIKKIFLKNTESKSESSSTTWPTSSSSSAAAAPPPPKPVRRNIPTHNKKNHLPKHLSVHGVRYEVSENGRKLRRIPAVNAVCDRHSGVGFSKKLFIEGEEYVEAEEEPGFLIRSRHSMTRASITSARNKSINTMLRIETRSRQYCMFFNKFGRCGKRDKGVCPYVHDVDKVAVCRRFLRGNCPADNECLLSHKVTQSDKIPVCKFFLSGMCTKGNDTDGISVCPYRHVKVDVCQSYIDGSCQQADKCPYRHPVPSKSTTTAGFEPTYDRPKVVPPLKPQRKSLGGQKTKSPTVRDNKKKVRYFHEKVNHEREPREESGGSGDELFDESGPYEEIEDLDVNVKDRLPSYISLAPYASEEEDGSSPEKNNYEERLI